MGNGLKELLPVGSNMNDAAYPFRGEFRVSPELNHGHSNALKSKSTMLSIKITGSNIKIEQLEAPPGQELRCKLGVNGGPTRAVSFQSKQVAEYGGCLSVPGDGKEYTIIANVQGEAKHCCKMTFRGDEEAKSRSTVVTPTTINMTPVQRPYMRVRAPSPPQLRNLLQFKADGKVLDPSSGWYTVPLTAEECSLSISTAPSAEVTPSVNAPPRWEHHESALLTSPSKTQVTASQFTVEAVQDLHWGSTPVLQSKNTGSMISLAHHTRVSVNVQDSPFLLRLPCAPPQRELEIREEKPTAAPLFSLSKPTSSPSPSPPTSAFSPLPGSATPSPLPVVHHDSPIVRIPSIETSITTTDPVGPCFVVRAPGFLVRLVNENGGTAAGAHEASLTLAHKGAQWVSLSILTEEGKEVMTQRTMIPSLQPAPVNVQVVDHPEGFVEVSVPHGSSVMRGQKPVPNPLGNLRVNEGDPPQQFTVQQRNRDGSISSVELNVQTRNRRNTNSYLTGNELPRVEADSGIRPASSLSPPPLISFSMGRQGFQDVVCDGYQLSAAIGSQVPQIVQAHSPLLTPPGSTVVLSAVNPATGLCAGACRISQRLEPSDDENFCSRVLEVLQKHSCNPKAVAEELAAIQYQFPLSGVSQRALPLLIECLRNAVPPTGLMVQKPEPIYVTANEGFLENIFTKDPNLKLHLSLDNAPFTSVFQHSRIPEQGTFPIQSTVLVHFVASDPESGAVKGECYLNVVGPKRSNERPPSIPASNGSSLSTATLPPSVGMALPVLSSAAPTTLAPPTSSGLLPPEPPLQPPPPLPHSSTAFDTAVVPYQQSTPSAAPSLGLSMQYVDQETHVRLTCAPQWTIKCLVDGVGGSTGRSDVLAKVQAGQSHVLEVSLLDTSSQMAFEQRLEIPPLGALDWQLAMEENSLLVQPDTVRTTTISADQQPEEVMRDARFSLDMSKPHLVHLRRYLKWPTKTPAGELTLQLPGGILPKNVSDLIRTLERREAEKWDKSKFDRKMEALKDQCTSPLWGDLLKILMNVVKSGGGSVITKTAEGPRVFFRLTGAE